MTARLSPCEELTSSQLFTLNVHFCNPETGETHTITLDKAVALEPADNRPDTQVKVTSERRVGDPYPIKVTLTNLGNVPQYGIPVNIAFDNVDKLDEFHLIDADMLVSDSLYNSRGFFTYTDNLVGTGKKGFFLPLLIPYIGGNEQLTLPRRNRNSEPSVDHLRHERRDRDTALGEHHRRRAAHGTGGRGRRLPSTARAATSAPVYGNMQSMSDMVAEKRGSR